MHSLYVMLSCTLDGIREDTPMKAKVAAAASVAVCPAGQQEAAAAAAVMAAGDSRGTPVSGCPNFALLWTRSLW